MATTYKVGNKRYTLEQMRANPRLRGKLPTRLLTTAQQAMRKENTRLNSPAGPGSSITTRDMDALLKSSFGTQQKSLDQQKANIPVWYDQYRTQLQGYQANQQKRSTAASDAIKSFAAQATQNTASATGAQNQQNAQTQAVTGGQGDPNASSRQDAAENVRQSMIGSYAGLSNQLGQNQVDFLQGAQTQSFGLQNNANLDLQKLYAALGDQETKFRQDTLTNEQKTKQINAAFNLKSSDTKADNYRADQALRERNRHNIVSESNANARLRLAKKKAKSGGPTGKDAYGNTVKQRAVADDNWTSAVRASRKVMANSTNPHSLGEEYVASGIRLSDSSVPPPIARIAARRALTGKVSASDRRKLKIYGITL